MKSLWIKRLFVLTWISAASILASLPQGWSDPGMRSEGRDEALRVCDQLNSLSQRDDCRTLVGQTRTFTIEAVLVCGAMDFDPHVTDCLRAIADRIYSVAEVQSCQKEAVDRRKIECFSKLGQVPGYGLPPHVERSIRSAIQAIDAGYPYDARQTLLRLLRQP